MPPRPRITFVRVCPAFVDLSRVGFAEAPPAPPAPEPKRRRPPREQVAASRARRVREHGGDAAPAGEFPRGWELVSEPVGLAVRDTVREGFHFVFLDLAGALCERGCPPSGVEAVIAHAHTFDPGWSHLLGARLTEARTTVAHYLAGEPITGYDSLRERAPAVADALDAGLEALHATNNSPVVRRVRAQLAAAAPESVSADEAAEIVAREIREAKGLVVIDASVGAGKTQGTARVARELPPLPPPPERAKPGARMAYLAPTHKLVNQTAEQVPRSLVLRSPLAHMTDGKPTCVYADAARELARGGQSVGYELCRGRGKNPCEHYDGCAARDPFDGDDRATFVASVHQLGGAVLGKAGKRARLVVDEPGELLAVEPVTLDDLEIALRRGDAFEQRYEAAIRPALVAFAAWVARIGDPNAEGLTSLPDMIRAAAGEAPADVLTAAGIDPAGETIGDAIIRAALWARVVDEGESAGEPSCAPPLLRDYEPLIARKNPGRAAETGTASRVRHLLRLGLMPPFHAGRVSEDLGERAVNLVGPNEALSTALAHTGPVVILDASARLIVGALRRERPDLRYVDLRVRDGAPIRRTILATNRATYSALMPRGVADWHAALPLLRAALAWLAEDPTARSAALFLPMALEVGVAYTLRPDAPETVALLRSVRVPVKTLRGVAELLRPVLATWPGELLTGHYGALRGRDDWKHVDATITLGDPRPNLGGEVEKALYLGAGVDAQCEARAACELQQSQGRLRTPHRTKPGRQLHVGSVVPAGWEGLDVDVRPLAAGRPRTVGAMTAAELEACREASGLTGRAFAAALKTTDRAVRNYLSGGRAVPASVATAARLLAGERNETPLQNTLLIGVSFRSETSTVEPPATGVSFRSESACAPAAMVTWSVFDDPPADPSAPESATGFSAGVTCGPATAISVAPAAPGAQQPAAAVLPLPLPASQAARTPTRRASGDFETHRIAPWQRNGGSR